jgi:hypothetical protein
MRSAPNAPKGNAGARRIRAKHIDMDLLQRTNRDGPHPILPP